MRRAIVASVRATFAVPLFVLATYAIAFAVPPLANGQGVSCQTCHTTFPGMTAYGMMTMMSNFQNLDWKKQHQALPIAVREQIVTFLSNKDHPGTTQTKTLSLFAAGFLGRNFTYYAEQPIVDTGQPGVTEQLWLSWNGLFGGTNSLQVGKYHTPFPFMPAHGWTLSDYLLATQDSGQNTFEPNGSHWGVAFNGMSNEFMYNLAYLADESPVQGALNYNRTNGPRTVDLNVSYGGMTKPYTIGLVAMRGTTPLKDADQNFIDIDAFTREGVYYSYQTRKYLFQTMYYRGFDSQPDIGSDPAELRGFMVEAQRDFSWKDHLVLRYDVASSDSLNRQYVVSYAHHFLPNLKLTGEVMMSPQNRPVIGFALDFAGPFVEGNRFVLAPQGGIRVIPTASYSPPVAVAATPAAAASAPAANLVPMSSGDANAGSKLVQNNGCMGCHGAKFEGGIGPALYGLEHKLSPSQIADFIRNPRAPMPNFGFNESQISDIVAYISNLDGGIANDSPVITWDPPAPSENARLTVRFPGTPPKQVSVRAVMHMGAGSHHTDVTMQPTADPHVWQGDVHFSMGGPWNIELTYDGKLLDIPLNVGQ